MSIKASNNVFPHDPDDNFNGKLDRGGYEGTAQDLKNEINALEKPDGVLIRGEVVKTGNVLSIAPLAFTCRIDQVELTNIDEFETTIATATDNYHRIDIGVFTKFGTIVKIQGIEGLDAAQKPDVPADTIEIFFTSVFGSVIGEAVTPPEITDLFVKKTERQKVIISENVSSFTLIDERHFVEFANASQGDFDYFVQSPTYVSGQNHPFRIRNNTGQSFTLNHLTPSGSSIPGETLLFFQNGENFDIKDKEIIEFVYDTDNNRYEYFGVIPDLSNKADLVSGKVPSSQLPSYVDDILEGYLLSNVFYAESGHTTVIPAEIGKIYIDITAGQKNKEYRYSGSTYIQITNGLIASTADVPEDSGFLYFTVARVLATLLTGISFATGGDIVSTDSVLVAFGKLQKQITDCFIIAKTDTISLSMSDTVSVLATGDTDPINAPYNFTLLNYWVVVKTAPTATSIIVDVKKNGVSITSTKASIDPTEKTSLTGVSPVLTTTSFTKGDEITPAIIQVGSGESGRALKIYLEIIKT